MHRTRMIYYISLAMAALIIGSGCAFAAEGKAQSKAATPFTGMVVFPEDTTPFNIVATIMEIHPGYIPKIVVAERDIIVTDFQYGNTVKTPRITDQNGNILKFKDFRVGQRVIVVGLELADKTIVAEHIKVQPKGN